ncbi:MAG: MFS transporter, partial [Bacteroidota bacterium]
SFAFLPAIDWLGGGISGYTRMALVLAAILLVCLGITFWGVREKQTDVPVSEVNWREVIQFLPKNRPFWLLCICFGACFAGWAGFAATAPYYYRYVVGDSTAVSWVFLIVMGVSTLTIPLWTLLSRRIEKRGVFLWGALCYSLAFLGVFFLGVESKWLGYALFSLQGLGNGAAVYTSWAMIPDTVEYGEWKSGYRLEAILYGIYGVFIKLGLGLGTALIGYGLAWAGYNVEVAPSSAVLGMIKGLFSLLPLVAVIIAAAAMYAYPLTASCHASIRTALQQKKDGSTVAAIL